MSTLETFFSHFSLDRRGHPRDVLSGVVRAFSCLPYENLTKILKKEGVGNSAQARREPLEVVRDHIAWGTGGTCFSLAWTLLHLCRSLGYEAAPVLADRRYGENTHCAVVLRLDGRPHLLDPGFLIQNPVHLDGCKELRLATPFNRLVLRPRDGGEKVDLFTEQQESPQASPAYRLTFKMAPVDESQFVAVWESSFDWDMMRYPLLTQVKDERHVYLQGRKLQRRSGQSVYRSEVEPEKLVERVALEFGINVKIVASALDVLGRRGEMRRDVS